MKQLLSRFIILAIFATLMIAPTFAQANPQISLSRDEVVLSGVKARIGKPAQEIVITNTGDATLNITGIAIETGNSTEFQLEHTLFPFPKSVAPSESISVFVRYTPGTVLGSRQSLLRISSNDSNTPVAEVGLYGLTINGIEGNNEAKLVDVVKTLGYNIDVGFTTLTCGISGADNCAFPLGDQQIMPLFRKATPGEITVKPVARYSPPQTIPYGYYFPDESFTPTLNEVAVISDSTPWTGPGEIIQDPPNHQTLNPYIDEGGSYTFDPGYEPFGFYVVGLQNRITYSEDHLNVKPPAPTSKAVIVYPAKDRAGVLIPNTYLIGFEDAANGDYQDYVFVISNVQDPSLPYVTPTPEPTETPEPTPTATEPTVTATEPTVTATEPTSTATEPTEEPTTTATSTEPTSTATEPTEQPTTTATATEPTATPTDEEPSGFELIENGEFEAGEDGWKVKNSTGDKVKTDKPEKDKFFAHEGASAFMFKGGANENSKIVQKPALDGIGFEVGDVLTFSLYAHIKKPSAAKYKVVVKYSDSDEKTKINGKLETATDGYEFFRNSESVTSTAVSKIKVVVSNKSTSGKLFVDNVSLTLHKSGSAALLPLPNAQ